jgi:hypothetical protein
MTEESDWDGSEFFEQMMSRPWSRWLFYLYATINLLVTLIMGGLLIWFLLTDPTFLESLLEHNGL